MYSTVHTQEKKIWLTKPALICIGKHFASSKLLPEYIYCLCKFFMLSAKSKLGRICEVCFKVIDIPLFCGLCGLQYTVKAILFSSGAFNEIF